MSSATDESDTPRSGHRRLRIALIGCFAAFCLAVIYVLLSAPLLLYAAHHPGSSYVQLVETYMQPLFWADELMTPDVEVEPSPSGSDHEIIVVGYRPALLREEPIHRKILFRYYDLWDPFLSLEYSLLGLERFTLPEPDPFYHYP